MLKQFLLVGLGGALGSMARYGVALLIPSRSFPYATLAVNIAGCFIIGLVLAMSIKDESFLQHWKLFLAAGICGGFTTFSAFSLENMEMLQNGRLWLAIIYVFLSIVLGIAASFLGYFLISRS